MEVEEDSKNQRSKLHQAQTCEQAAAALLKDAAETFRHRCNLVPYHELLGGKRHSHMTTIPGTVSHLIFDVSECCFGFAGVHHLELGWLLLEVIIECGPGVGEGRSID